MKYRAEIDGLRALAVVPIILFHAEFELFSGGFLGVDVFFVISGYLITTILIEDIENKRLSIVNFYERRARRILPALAVMVITTITLGWFVLTPYFLSDLFQTTAAISFFASNILLYIKSGYFSAISELKPFLHTWSLAVEEQYYIVFPIFLAFAYRFGRRAVFWITAFLCLVSLLMSEWSWRVDKEANFYLLHTRAWELLTGSISAFIIQKQGVQKNNPLALLGLAAIVFSIFFYDETMPFPGVYALVPVLGAVLLVLYAEKETLVAKLLSTKGFIGIGLISYSAYLWHQPIFALMKHSKISEPTQYNYILAIGIIFLVSVVTWKYVEQPFRNKSTVNSKKVFLFSTLFISLMALVGLYGHVKLGFPERLSYETNSISKGAFDKNPRQKECHYIEKLKGLKNACVLGTTENTEPSIALIGNSHGDMFAKSLSDSLSSNDLAAYNLSFNGCSPVDFEHGSSSFSENSCYKLVMGFLSEHKEISSVIVSFRWILLISGTGYGVEKLNDDKDLLPQDVVQKRAEVVAKKIEELAKLEKHIVIVYPVPEAGVDVPNFVTKQRMFNDENFYFRIPYETFKQRNSAAYAALDSVKEIKSLSRIYPSSVICDESINGFCETVIDGRSVYFDDDHLSNYGASLITPDIIHLLTKISDRVER